MAIPSVSPRVPTYKPRLAFFAGVGTVWVFVLVTLGAFTTSIGAGMAFPDWPLSNGSINPEGWLDDLAMFAEHSHRLSGTLMGLITIGLVVWLSLREQRRWLRTVAWWSLGLVIFQGVLGGTRVLLDRVDIPGFHMTLGQMLRVPHGVLAQVYVALLIAIAVGCTKNWIERPLPVKQRLRTWGLVCCGLILLQLIIATLMRHNGAGLAITTFPRSTPSGDWLPQAWDLRVTLHFAHRVMALILAFALAGFVWVIRRDRDATLPMRAGASALLTLLVLQILLGMEIIRTFRQANVTTSHVVVGALILAITFWLTLVAHRDRIETAATKEVSVNESKQTRARPVAQS